MELHISENIRAYRKQRNMMQEQLAEILGVSVGAVSKWERGAAVPDLGYIVQIAELFEVSVDSLLGYELNKSGLAATLEKLVQCSKQNLFEEGKTIAEKALKQFPNHFQVVYRSGAHYMFCTISQQEPQSARRAIELLHRCLELFSDNTDNSICQEEIYHDIAVCHMFLDEHEEAIRLLAEHNPRNVHDGDIGMIYANHLGQPEKAFPYLENALDCTLARLCRTMLGFAAAYDATKQYQKTLDVWNWMANLLLDLKKDDCDIFYYYKFVAVTYVNCAYASARLKRQEDAADYLRKAYIFAQRFDQAPIYTLAGTKFDEGKLSFTTRHDNLGETALAGIEAELQNVATIEPILPELWQTIKQEYKQ